MTPQELTVFGTLAGTLIGALATLAVTWLTKRSEERKHYREIIVNTAVQYHNAIFEARKVTGGTVLSLDYYIIHMTKLAELLNKKNITPEDIDRIYNESEELQDKMYERVGKRIGKKQTSESDQ